MCLCKAIARVKRCHNVTCLPTPSRSRLTFAYATIVPSAFCSVACHAAPCRGTSQQALNRTLLPAAAHAPRSQSAPPGPRHPGPRSLKAQRVVAFDYAGVKPSNVFDCHQLGVSTCQRDPKGRSGQFNALTWTHSHVGWWSV